jgi:ferredoxin
VHVRLHPERCMGSGICRSIAPTVFDLGRDGWVTLLDGQPTDRSTDAAQDAADACPTGSIEIIEDERE